MSQNEFNIHLAKVLGIPLSRAQELGEGVFATLYYFVKKKGINVPTKIGTFKAVKSRNGFKAITLDERPTIYDQNPHAGTTTH